MKEFQVEIDILTPLKTRYPINFREIESIAQWSSSLGGGDKTVPKRLKGCSMDMLPHMTTYGKKIKGHVFLYAYFSFFLA